MSAGWHRPVSYTHLDVYKRQVRDRYGDGAAVQTVNARELHGFLESRADFSTWIKQQIERARLAEGRDYLVHKIVERQNQGLTGQGRIDYHLTLEAAKHIGMMSGTGKGLHGACMGGVNVRA